MAASLQPPMPVFYKHQSEQTRPERKAGDKLNLLGIIPLSKAFRSLTSLADLLVFLRCECDFQGIQILLQVLDLRSPIYLSSAGERPEVGKGHTQESG